MNIGSCRPPPSSCLGPLTRRWQQCKPASVMVRDQVTFSLRHSLFIAGIIRNKGAHASTLAEDTPQFQIQRELQIQREFQIKRELTRLICPDLHSFHPALSINPSANIYSSCQSIWPHGKQTDTSHKLGGNTRCQKTKVRKPFTPVVYFD